MFTANIAVVSQTKNVPLAQLVKAAAAIQKQVTRDMRQDWQVEATVDAFDQLSDVPLGYWAVIIRDQIKFQAQGIHLNNKNGQPFALVKFSEHWTLTTSHEVLEMLVDPSGNRLIAGNSVKPDQGRVNYLVEVCDPSEAAEFAYTVNGILVSDFYTPHFFEPKKATGVRYSFTGAIEEPRKVLDGGYLSWWEPVSSHLWQLFVENGEQEFVDQGEVALGELTSMRRLSDIAATTYREKMQRGLSLEKPATTGLLLSALGSAAPSSLDKAVAAVAKQLQEQIEALTK